jgi:methanogenic corrinoid protein MtbC1
MAAFVLETIAPLTEAVGEAWADGRLQVHQEHAYSVVVESILRSAIGGLGQSSGNAPRVILATPSGELHALGILMTQAVLSLQGAHPIQLGPQVPVGDIVGAVQQHRADIVGLSFSWSYPPRQAKAVLSELRRVLDPAVEVWAGGRAVTRLGRMPAGVYALPTFPEALARLEAIRCIPGTDG